MAKAGVGVGLQHAVEVAQVSAWMLAFTCKGEALDWAATHRPIAVILDYLMPDIDGIEFTRRFRVLPGKACVPVLMVTGCNYGDLRQRARSVGVDEFLTKPVNYVHLSRRIMEIYGARSQRNEVRPIGSHALEEWQWKF
jgi:CheY-like chemotaxis protein